MFQKTKMVNRKFPGNVELKVVEEKAKTCEIVNIAGTSFILCTASKNVNLCYLLPKKCKFFHFSQCENNLKKYTNIFFQNVHVLTIQFYSYFLLDPSTTTTYYVSRVVSDFVCICIAPSALVYIDRGQTEIYCIIYDLQVNCLLV